MNTLAHKMIRNLKKKEKRNTDFRFNSALQAKTHLTMQFLSESALSDVQLVIKLRANQAWGAIKFQESA